MLRSNKALSIIPSLLDRLLDDNPEADWEANPNESWDVQMLVESIRQDLEDLLNTRLGFGDEIPGEFSEVKKSLVVYGLPDISSFSRKSQQDQRRLIQIIENAIKTFEPRLHQVQVSVKEKPGADKFEKSLQFTIVGVLRVDPAPERVVFDTQLELTSGQYKVEGAR